MGVEVTQIAGQGWVFTADVDTAIPDLTKFNEANLKGLSGWTWIGHTSKENLPEISYDGGDVTSYDTWDTPAMRSDKAPIKWGATLNVVSLDQDVLKTAFPGGAWDESTGAYALPAKIDAKNAAVLIVVKDTLNGYGGFYFPNGAVSTGGAPKLNVEGYTETPITVSAQASAKTKSPFSLIPPKKSTSEDVGG